MLGECFAPKTHIEDIVTKDYWLGQLGSLYTKNTDKMMDSGKSTMRFFERLLDLTSKDVLKINQVNKISIYSIVRWMVQNFPELRQKNNLDLSTKRLRLGECIASLLSMRIGESVNRILTFGNKVDIDQVITNIFSFSGNLVIQAMQNSQLMRFDDLVNDLDTFSALKYTIKGLIYNPVYRVIYVSL